LLELPRGDPVAFVAELAVAVLLLGYFAVAIRRAVNPA
jgi:hypothetical protein